MASMLSFIHFAVVIPFARTNYSRPWGLTKSQQTALANEWWCAQPGHNPLSLGCRRHVLQQRFASTPAGSARENVQRELRDLLVHADASTMSAMRADTREMWLAFCSLSRSRHFSLCTPQQGFTRLPRHKSNTKHPTSGLLARRRKGIAVLWTAETLSLLRAWWCSDRKHARDHRCSQGIRWTRQQPGLSAMRRLFCAKNPEGHAASILICHGIPGVAPAVHGGNHQSIPTLTRNAAALVHGRPRRGLRSRTVSMLMVGLLAAAALVGWSFARSVHVHIIRGSSSNWCCCSGAHAQIRAAKRDDCHGYSSKSYTNDAPLGEREYWSATARRRLGRLKRQRRDAAGLDTDVMKQSSARTVAV